MPPTVWILVAARAVNQLGAFTLTFLSLTLVEELGATVTRAGYLLAAFGLATIPSRLIGGRLADSVGAKSTIVIGLIGTALAQVAVAGSQTLTQATCAVLGLGLMFEIYEPSSQAVIADVTPPDRRPAAYGLLAAALAAAGVVSGLLAAVLASIDLRWLFIADAATCVICAAAVATLLPASARTAPDLPPPGAREGWKDRRLLVALGWGTVFAVVYLQLFTALPLTLTARGFDPSTMGVLLTVSATTMIAGQAVLTRTRLRDLDDVTALTLGSLVLACGLLATGYATTLIGFAVASIIWSVGELVLVGRAYTVVTAISPAGGRGTYLAIYGTSWGVAGIAAPLTGTQLLTHGGPPLLWTLAASLCLLLAATPRLLRTHLAPRPT